MRFLVDECTGPRVAEWLASQGHDVFSVYDKSPGAADEDLLDQADAEDRIVVTNDRDFGELIFKGGRSHKGVVFLRLHDERSPSKIRALASLLVNYTEGQLLGQFVVVNETQVRFAGRTLP
jgi:predicted nuclease of predicted toxin-antitoxin system